MTEATQTPMLEIRDIKRDYRVPQGLFKDEKIVHAVKGVSFTLENGAEKRVVLEVKNAFGQVAKRKFDLQRPKVDMSGVIDVTQGANGQLQGTPRPAQQPGRPAAPPILPGAQLPAGHPALPQGH